MHHDLAVRALIDGAPAADSEPTTSTLSVHAAHVGDLGATLLARDSPIDCRAHPIGIGPGLSAPRVKTAATLEAMRLMNYASHVAPRSALIFFEMS